LPFKVTHAGHGNDSGVLGEDKAVFQFIQHTVTPESNPQNAINLEFEG
jgi:hypothetical protein